MLTYSFSSTYPPPLADGLKTRVYVVSPFGPSQIKFTILLFWLIANSISTPDLTYFSRKTMNVFVDRAE